MGLSNIKPFPYSLPLLNLIPFTIGRSEKLRSQGSTTVGHNAFDNLVLASKRSSNVMPSLLPAADAVASPSLSSTTSPMAQPTRRSTHCGDGGPGQQRYWQRPAPRRVRAQGGPKARVLAKRPMCTRWPSHGKAMAGRRRRGCLLRSGGGGPRCQGGQGPTLGASACIHAWNMHGVAVKMAAVGSAGRFWMAERHRVPAGGTKRTREFLRLASVRP